MKRLFWITSVIACVSGCAVPLFMEEAGSRQVGRDFYAYRAQFMSGELAIAMVKLVADDGAAVLCAAVGHDAAADEVAAEIITRWLKGRKVSVNGELIAADLSFATSFEKIEMLGETANCVEVDTPSGDLERPDYEVTGPPTFNSFWD